MLTLSVYKVIHLLAVLFLFVSVGGVAVHAANGGDKASNKVRRLLAVIHGLALLVVLVAGFGALARLQRGLEGWVWAKLTIWLLIGGLALLPYRKPQLARPLLIILPLLGGVAALLAITKPF